MTSTMAEVMPLAFANAFEEQTPESEKAFEDLMEKTTLKHLKSEDVTMATRKVKLNLEKNKMEYIKLSTMSSFTESIFANLSQLEDLFGGGDDGAVSEEVAEEPQSRKNYRSRFSNC